MVDQERRRATRHHCDNRWIEVVTKNEYNPAQISPSIKVRVENISITGCCLIASSPFEIGQALIFSEADIPSQGTVVWTCQSKHECKAGVQFS